jgi:hypothetical protein
MEKRKTRGEGYEIGNYIHRCIFSSKALFENMDLGTQTGIEMSRSI